MTKDKEYIGDLILVRGLPGSGKSTISEIILQHPSNRTPEVLSADDFFINPEGEYVFDATKLKEAHNYCQFRCSERMRQGIIRIVVANTFTEEWEMKPYFDLAMMYGYTVFTVIVENRHGGVNQHNVPDATLGNMRNRFEIKL